MKNSIYIASLLVYLNVNALIAQQTPYNGTPAVIPGQIEAEDFDNGGEGIAFHDTDDTNEGGAYRTTGVDIESCGEGGYNVGWIATDEWLEYTVNVLSTNEYNFYFRVASESAGGNFHVKFDGVDVTGSISFEATGAWQTYTTVNAENIMLAAGEHVMQFYCNSSSFNVNYINVQSAMASDPPDVIITSPLDETTFSFGTEITLTATATDSDGTVTKVMFYADEELIGEDTSAPYEITWQPEIPENYNLIAIALDNTGTKGTSKKVDISVLYPQYANSLIFSHKHGFYSDAFTLNISSESGGTTIKYTLDGSDPMTSATAFSSAEPANISINPASTSGRGLTPGVVVRAVALSSGSQNSLRVTKTYLFIDEVRNQDHPGGSWPDPGVNGQQWHYEMNQDVVTNANYSDLIDDALLDIPSISLVTDLDNLFDPDDGIYVNAQYHGEEWERPTSVELLNPDGTDGFQINAGLRIRGGWSRHDGYPKHAFRLFFRERYGKAKLEYPLFEAEGVDEFKKLDLRTSQNYAWSNGMIWDNTMNRDVFSRDLQGQMGQPYTRSRYYHLYINGEYWGLFQSQERPEANFAESYLGGNDNDYDVVKVDIGDDFNLYDIEATDGNLDAYEAVWDATQTGYSSNANYFQLEGKNPDGTVNPAGRKLVDIDNLIDYMILIFYTGNFDAPVSKFGGDTGPNNFYAIYNRNANDGFIFLAHDNEHTLHVDAEPPGDGITEDRVNIDASVYSFNKFHPQWLHNRLSENTEYQVRFADRVYKHFNNEGVIQPDRLVEIFMQSANIIDMAIIAESARWGDMTRSKITAWEPAVTQIADEFFSDRGDIVIDQFKEAGIYPTLDAPLFETDGSPIEINTLSITGSVNIDLVNPNGTTGSIYYTLDGTDPRLLGGSISSSALSAGDGTTLAFDATQQLSARINNGSEWSPLHTITIVNPKDLNALQLNEIHYHPLDEGIINDTEFEFLEFKNTGVADLDLSLISFTEGITYTFPASTILSPGAFYVIASNSTHFDERYGFTPDGEYEGQLDNGGEKLLLSDAAGDTLIFIRYDDESPWPVKPDGEGNSLVWTNKTNNDEVNNPLNWSVSGELHGSPGAENTVDIEQTDIDLPDNYMLYQNYPNPFNPITTIKYALPKASLVKIDVFNVIGQRVQTLFEDYKIAGYHTVKFDANGLSSGLYFYRISTPNFTSVRKMIIMK